MFTKKVVPHQQTMEVDQVPDPSLPQTIQARLVSEQGEEAGPPIDLPSGVTTAQLALICNAFLQNVGFYLYIYYYYRFKCTFLHQ